MSFKMTESQAASMEAVDSTYKFTNRPDKGQLVQCELVDNYRKIVWAEGFGADEADAFADALKNSQAKAPPSRPAEHAQGVIDAQQSEIEQLKAKLAKLEGKGKSRGKAEPEKSELPGGGDKTAPPRVSITPPPPKGGKPATPPPAGGDPPDEEDEDDK